MIKGDKCFNAVTILIFVFTCIYFLSGISIFTCIDYLYVFLNLVIYLIKKILSDSIRILSKTQNKDYQF
jgi:hypothetical protein